MIWKPIALMSTNLGISIEWIILAVALFAGAIFYAKDTKLGLSVHILLTGSLFVWYYQNGWNYTPALVMMLAFVTLLSLTLLAVRKNVFGGGYI